MKRYLILGFVLVALFISGCQQGISKTGGAIATPTSSALWTGDNGITAAAVYASGDGYVFRASGKPPTKVKCGNGVIDPGEQCDGSNLAELTCANLKGFTGGTLACYPPGVPNQCKRDTRGCY